MSQSSEETFSDAEQAAISHSWDYFVFHAQQRQTVFNFYLILVGASVAAYATTFGKVDASLDYFHSVLGIVIVTASFLFWRLDKRNSRLVKLAEEPLKRFEIRLAHFTDVPDVTILARADTKIESGVFSSFESFGQIYRLVFVLAGAGGLAVVALSMKKICL